VILLLTRQLIILLVIPCFHLRPEFIYQTNRVHLELQQFSHFFVCRPLDDSAAAEFLAAGAGPTLPTSVT
jgi:hypothetical protein